MGISDSDIEMSTDVLFGGVCIFIAIIYLVSFVIAGVYRRSSPAVAFKWMKAIGAGTFFSYSQICMQKHGVQLYSQSFLGVQGAFLWVQPLIFALLVMFESNYFCLFHVRGQGLSTRQYAPLMGLAVEFGMDGNGAGTSAAAAGAGTGAGTELTMMRNGLRQHADEENAGERSALQFPDARDSEEEDDDLDDLQGGSSQHGMLSGTVVKREGEGAGRHRHRHSAHEGLLLAEMRARLAEEGGFPLLPTLAIACLEGFAIGFELGDIARGKPQFMWSYLHLIFNKTMLAVGWAAVLHAKLGVMKEYLTLLSVLILAAATPAGILIGQLYHNKIDSSVLKQPTVLNLVFCAASGMYMYLAAFTLAEDWKQRKVTGVVAALAVAVVSNIYLDE